MENGEPHANDTDKWLRYHSFFCATCSPHSLWCVRNPVFGERNGNIRSNVVLSASMGGVCVAVCRAVCVWEHKKQTCICTHYLFGNMHWSVHMHWRSMAVNEEERTLFRVFFVCFSCWPHQRWSLSISFGSGITYKMVHINGNCLAVIKRYDSMGFVVVCVCGAYVLLFTGCDRHRGHRHHPQHSTARRA